MNRGEVLQWGLSIDTDTKVWNVTYGGSQRPDHVFETFEDLIDWLEDQNEGLKISRLGKHNG